MDSIFTVAVQECFAQHETIRLNQQTQKVGRNISVAFVD